MWALLAVVPATAPAADPPPALEPAPVVPMVQRAAPIEAPNLDWSHARQMHRLVEGWVKAGAVPEPAEVPGLWASNASGVRVTLRWLGLSMGRGDAQVPPELRPPPGSTTRKPTDLAALARMATQNALAEVLEALKDAKRRAAAAGTVAASAAPTTLAEMGPRLLVDVQIAGALQPVNILADAESDAVYHKFAPGFHGLVLGVTGVDGKRREAWTWPASALAANLAPQSQLVTMLNDLGRTSKDVLIVGRPKGPELARFEAIHVARPTADSPALQLVRGNALLPDRSVTARTLDALAQRLSDHLVRRMRPDGSVAGTYLPPADRYDPADAPAQDAALAAYALAHRARLMTELAGETPASSAAAEAARRCVRRLGQQLLRDQPPLQDAPAAALAVLAITELPQLAEQKADRDALVKRLLSLQGADGAFKADSSTDAALLGTPVQALVSHALAAAYEQTRADHLLKAVNRAQERLWQQGGSQLGAGMPWAALAAYRLRRLEDPADPAARQFWADRAAVLASLARTMREAQVDSAALGPQDVMGGFNLVKQPPESPPSPDWRSAHVLTFLAAHIRDSGTLSNEQKLDGLLACGSAARFLAQLMFDEPSCYFVRSRDDALGGVRPALWDNRLSAAPTAMTLLAVTELQQTLASLSQLVGEP